MLAASYVDLREQPRPRRELLCRRFFEEIYVDAFPDPDETEGPDTWLPLMEDDAGETQPVLHAILACDAQERILGGIVFERYRKSGCWLATYLAVRPDARRRGVATGLLARAVAVMAAEGEASAPVLAEAEIPACIPDPGNRARAWRRLRFLKMLGMRRVPIEYVQPALSPTQHVLATLYLLCYAPNGAPTVLDSARLAGFLEEFYAALGQPRSPSLQQMLGTLAARPELETLELPALAPDDATLGSCRSIALRVTFIDSYRIERRPSPLKPWKQPQSARAEIELNRLRAGFAKRPELGDGLLAPVMSFYNDVVTPYGTEGNLPLVVMCEPFRDQPDRAARTRAPHHVQIHVPGTFSTRWEKNRKLEIAFAEREDDEFVRRAKLVDNVTFFASGYLAYSLSFVFDAPAEGVPLNAQLLLVLNEVAGMAGRREGRPVRFALDGEPPVPLSAFVRRRLAQLEAGARRRDTLFTLLSEPATGELGASLRRAVATFNLPGEVAFEGRISIGIEICGCSRHADVLRYAQQAEERVAPVDDFSRRLAGLVQNVIDFELQDKEEVHDSLAGGLKIGTDITFVHKDVAVRFSEGSRSYDEMRHVVGGSPYWLLVQLVLGHNEAVLSDLSKDLERDYGNAGLTGMMQALLDVPRRPYSMRDSQQRLTRMLRRRIRLAHYIPNLFRYPTERKLYDLFSKARGLEAQHAYFVTSEDTLEKAVREISTLNKERIDSRITRTLIALGLIQVAGAFVAIAAINDADFWFFGQHFDQPGWLSRLFNDFMAFSIQHRQSSQQPPEFTAVWALWPALAIMVAGFCLLAVIGIPWLYYYLRDRFAVRAP